MIFRRKITLIISLIFFQLFYLLAHYSGQYLNLFFLLTSLAALIVCYNVYQLLLQIFTSQKIDSELSLLQKQQALKTSIYSLYISKKATLSNSRNSLRKLFRKHRSFFMQVIAKKHTNSFIQLLKLFRTTVFILIAKIILYLSS